MRGPKPDPVTLSQAERTDLEELVHRHSTPHQQALRARIILAAAEGKNNSQIARELDVCVDTVRHWRRRWIGLQAATLDDLPVKERRLRCAASRTACPDYGRANLPDGGAGL